MIYCAKNNNIANPDLIYAGTSLNLLFENEPTTQASNKECKNTSPAKEDMPAIEIEKTNKEAYCSFRKRFIFPSEGILFSFG